MRASQNSFKREVILTINARDFTFRELQDIYRDLKKELVAKREIPVKEKHVRVYELIRKLGNPPRRGESGHYKFWQGALRAWKKRYRDERPQSWQGLRDLWERKIKTFRLGSKAEAGSGGKKKEIA
jgi:hypothetical protein